MAANLLLVALSLTVLALAGCSDDGGGDTHSTVEIHDNQFDPRTVTASPGEEMHVVNHDSVRHSLTSNTAGQFDTGDVQGGADGHFDAPMVAGSYPFHCKYHASMTGTLTVA